MDLSEYPGTADFDARVSTEIEQRTQQVMSEVLPLFEGHSPEVLAWISPHLRHHLQRVHELNVKGDYVPEGMGILYGWSLLLLTIALPLTTFFTSGISMNPGQWLGALFLYFVFVILGLGIATFPLLVAYRGGRVPGSISGLLVVLAWPAIIVLMLVRQVPDWAAASYKSPTMVFATRTAGLAIVAIGMAWLVMVICMVAYEAYLSRCKRHRADSYVVHSLIRVFYLLPRHTDVYDLEKRKGVVKLLEGIAIRLENQMSRLWRSGDSMTDEVMTSKSRELAHAQRAYKRLVFLSGPDGLAELKVKMQAHAIDAAVGQWANLPCEPIPAETRASRMRMVLRFVRAVIIASLPLVVLVSIGHFVPDIDTNLLNQLALVGYAWVLVSALLILDPLLGNKLTILKEAIDTLGNIGRGKS